jgi:hypothetical protein
VNIIPGGVMNTDFNEDIKIWEECNFENNIREILKNAKAKKGEHHFGYYFLSANQIAIDFAEKYPNDFKKANMSIGGSGAGNKSLSNYIARQLSGLIKPKIKKNKEPKIKDIEGAFLSKNHLYQVIFKDNQGSEFLSSYNDKSPTSKNNDSKRSFAMFRFIGE